MFRCLFQLVFFLFIFISSFLFSFFLLQPIVCSLCMCVCGGEGQGVHVCVLGGGGEAFFNLFLASLFCCHLLTQSQSSKQRITVPEKSLLSIADITCIRHSNCERSAAHLPVMGIFNWITDIIITSVPALSIVSLFPHPALGIGRFSEAGLLE